MPLTSNEEMVLSMVKLEWPGIILFLNYRITCVNYKYLLRFPREL